MLLLNIFNGKFQKIRVHPWRYILFAVKLHLLTTGAVVLLLTMLTASSATAQYIYVANAGEDTVSKIDINTNQEVARYATWFTSGVNHIPHLGSTSTGPAPSRVFQGPAGDLYVLNRFFSPPHLPVLLKIAPTGGIPGTTTSNGSTVLPMLDNNPTNNQIDPGEAMDVRIQWAKPIGNSSDVGALGRALCMDTSGVLWVGMYNTQRYYKVDSATGQMLAPLTGIPTPGHSSYGCQVDKNGKLWSVDGNNTLAEINTLTNQVTIRNHSAFGTNYSLSLYNGCGSTPGKVYLSERSLAKTYIAYDPLTLSFSNSPPTIPQFASWAVGVDRKGNIISGQYAVTGHVMKTTPSGTVAWHTNTAPAGPVVPAADLHGIIMDENDDVWAVHLMENRLVKYSGADGHWIATVPVGNRPYTYGNPPPPTCPCTELLEQSITCEGQSNGVATYAWSFIFTNHSPFLTPATTIDILSSQVTNLTPSPQFQFPNPVPPNGQATVSGTFTVASPVAGSLVCLDTRLNAGKGWCCPPERVCFRLPECPGCADIKAKFTCKNGKLILQLTVINQGPTAAQSITVFSNTPGVTVNPPTTTQTFPQNTPVTTALTVTGASPGQPLSLTVNLNGPFDPKMGVNTWCCTSTVKISYPTKNCAQTLEGWIFNDLDADGLRDSAEDGLSDVTVTLTADGQGTPRTALSDASGIYRFENVEQGTYRLSVQTPRGRRLTAPEGGVYTVTVGEPPERTFDFGLVKTQP